MMWNKQKFRWMSPKTPDVPGVKRQHPQWVNRRVRLLLRGFHVQIECLFHRPKIGSTSQWQLVTRKSTFLWWWPRVTQDLPRCCFVVSGHVMFFSEKPKTIFCVDSLGSNLAPWWTCETYFCWQLHTLRLLDGIDVYMQFSIIIMNHYDLAYW